MQDDKKVYELKIDTELRDLLPPLSAEEYNILEKQIIDNGCESPLFLWQGYIADGHNRYSICKKNNIPFNIINLGYKDKSEVMKWMINGQLGRRNLTPAQRVAVTEKYRPIFEEKARENLVKSGESFGIGKEKPLANLPNPIQSINTRAELAKLADVPERTYDKIKTVLDSDNEEIKKQLLKNEISADKAYNEVRPPKQKPANSINSNVNNSINTTPQKSEEKPKTKICNKCGTEKPIIDFFGDDKICKECKRKSEDGEMSNGGGFKDVLTGKTITSTQNEDQSESLQEIISEVKTSKIASDYIIIENEISWAKELLSDCFDQINNKFFILLKAIEKMNNSDIEQIIEIIETAQNQLNGLKIKFKNNKKGE